MPRGACVRSGTSSWRDAALPPRASSPPCNAGFGFTDPGFELRHRSTFMFNAQRNDFSAVYEDVLAARHGICDAMCILRLRSMASVHVHGREQLQEHRVSVEDLGAFVRWLLAAHGELAQQRGWMQAAALTELDRVLPASRQAQKTALQARMQALAELLQSRRQGRAS